jgi:hypothetical protein
VADRIAINERKRLLAQNLGPAPAGTGGLDFSVTESVRDLRLEGAVIFIDSVLVGFTRSIGVFRMNGIASGLHDLRIELSGYNSLTGSFDILPATTTIAEFRLVPFVNKYLTPYRFPSIIWQSTRYGPKSEPTSQ